MNRLYAIITGTLLLACIAGSSFGQRALVKDAKKRELANLSAQLNSQYRLSHQKALALAKAHGWPVFRKSKDGSIMSLQGVTSLGYPVYLATNDNIIAAASTNTTAVQPGGLLGLNLSGSSPNLLNKLAIWDGGSVYKAHQEFAGKTITIHDIVPVQEHSTHVAGTMVAKGIYSPARGMAFNASTLHSYDFNNDVAEMSAAAPGLLLSNHSYGRVAGWYPDDQGLWEWHGIPGDNVDYAFGFYDEQTQEYDHIAYNAPYYLIVESAGNSHGYPGPAVGDNYLGYKSATDRALVNKGPRTANISSNDGYDVISTTGNAKNILTVGAVNPLPDGPSNSSDIKVASFSSWGPTDDGRVKPDIVGDGVDVLSTGIRSTKDYVTLSGTSMAAPNVTGSLYLLQEYYAQKNGGSFMRAATLKGLACHTAFDAGNTGPDYIYGWGLLNMKQAAQAITDNGVRSLVTEKTLQQGKQLVFTVVASGDAPLSATISWTDPPGTPTPDGTINSRTPKLVNDLDIRVSDGTTTFYPWVLDPAKPSAAAKKGDNIVDNMEQVLIPGATFGTTYTITVSHKKTLQSGSQDYSLIVTGIGGAAYCASSPSSNADSRIDNLTLANINNTPPAGCTSYSDYKSVTVELIKGKTYPLSISLGTCGANFNKAAKVYIDWNSNGVFEPNELVATTNIINTATGTYTTNIAVPATVIPGNLSLMRVVLAETGDASAIQPCGTYAKGETQDYTVKFIIDPATAPAILAGTVTGAITACEGMASASPDIGQFKVSGKNLTGNIIATAPVGFEISLAPGSGFGNSLTIIPIAGIVNGTIIYIRSAASAPAGIVTGNIVLTSSGLSQNVKIAGGVTSAPTIKPVPNQGPYINGSTTNPINFTGASETYTWTNDTPGIGLAAGGNGNIPPFTAINNGNSPIVATITVTPTPYSFAYIGNYGSNNVSVINVTTRSLVTTIPVGKSPWGVSASADGRYVYVSNQDGGTVSVINTATNKVVSTIDIGYQVEGIAVSPDNSKVYVASLILNTISVINTVTNAITAIIQVGSNPTGVCINHAGSRVYVTNGISNNVSVINTANNAIIATIPVGQHPYGVTVSPDDRKLYVVNSDSKTVSVIDLPTNNVVSIIPVGDQPNGVCLTAGGKYAYVSNTLSSTLSVINTTNYAVSTLNTPYPTGLSLTLDGSQLYVSNSFDQSVSIFSTANNSLISTLSVGNFPYSLGNSISKGPGCSGTPITFTITIGPTSTNVPAITVNSAATGIIAACEGTASTSPDIQQFTVSGSKLVSNITASAPAGFEVSLSALSGYGNTVMLTPSAGVVDNKVVYVRSAASAPSGNLSGTVMLTATGAESKEVAVTGYVNALVHPSINIVAVSSNNICIGTESIFIATVANGGSAPVYQWLLNGNPAGTNDTEFRSSTLADGDVISCVMASSAPCATPVTLTSNSITMKVSTPQTPALSIEASANSICSGTEVTFTATPTNGGSTPVYKWMLNGNPAGTNDAAFTSNTLNNGDVVSCVMASNAPCAIITDASSNNITMNVTPPIVVNTGGNKTITAGNSVTLNAIATGDIADVTWTPATGLSNNKILAPVASPFKTTTYTLVVKTAGECVGMGTVTVTVQPPDIIVPNAFTPNGDGVNDTWVINHLNSYADCTVQIFNRWGQNVYLSIGYGIAWNGIYKGSPLPTGAYYYVIDLKDGSKLLSGYVSIIR